jgi:hypothetical protein
MIFWELIGERLEIQMREEVGQQRGAHHARTSASIFPFEKVTTWN